MRQLLNTLYVTTDRAYIHLDHETLRVEVERELKLQAPLLQLSGIVCIGDVMMSPALIHRCAEDGRSIALLDRRGRFKARIEGATSGNVLLRRAQHLALSDPERRLAIARNLLAGKLRNGRHVLMRAARETNNLDDAGELAAAALRIKQTIERMPTRDDLDLLRGDEGEAGRTYFSVFSLMVRQDREAFGIDGRTRRPPRDRMNAVLSFLYTLLRTDCVAALEGVGLDPQVGYLHALRPGRPALALDLMEELRPALADRLALTLVNRGQLKRDDFEIKVGATDEETTDEATARDRDQAVYLNETGRRTVIMAYQERKQEEVDHRVVGKKVPFGLVPHLQARLLARHLRDDLAYYPPFLLR
jgi:CRISPR-associated protein Cas1